MKKKTLLIVGCVAAVVAVAAAILVPTVIQPALKRSADYAHGQELIESGEYKEAADTFDALGDYKDAAALALSARYKQAEDLLSGGAYDDAIEVWQGLVQYEDSAARIEEAKAAKEAAQKEEDYAAACSMLDNGEYKDAISAFTALKGYKDADVLLIDATYNYAEQLFKKGSYKEAIDNYQAVGGYEDAEAKIREATYQYGCKLLESKNYAQALKQFELVGDYLDAAEKMLEAKYGFVTAENAVNRSETFGYVKELLEVGYPGAQEAYDALYSWRVEVTAINMGENNWVNYESISKYRTVFFFFTVLGGEPNATVKISARAVFPNGTSVSTVFDEEARAGNSSYITTSYGNPDAGSAGTLKVTFYDGDNNVIGEASVKLTN